MSLYVLDTDIFSLWRHGHATVVQHIAQHSPTDVATTIITVEEQLTGWYTQLRRATRPDRLARAYQELTNAVVSFTGMPLLTYTEPAIHRYNAFVAQRLTIGKMDLRIASIVLENQAIV